MIDNQTVLFAPTELVNDVNGRMYHRMAKCRDFQILTFRSELSDRGVRIASRGRGLSFAQNQTISSKQTAHLGL
jgi:hypothetical protein